MITSFYRWEHQYLVHFHQGRDEEGRGWDLNLGSRGQRHSLDVYTHLPGQAKRKTCKCPVHLGPALTHPQILARLHGSLGRAVWWALVWTPG